MGQSKRRSGKRSCRPMKGGAGASEFVASAVGGTVSQQMQNSLQGGDNVIKLMRGGRRKNKRPSKRRSSQKGGYWAQVISSAAVPLSLFALYQHFAKRSKRHSRKFVNNNLNTRKRR